MYLKNLTKGFFILVLSFVTLIFVNILLPYFSVILWAGILTIIFNPTKNRLRNILGNQNGLASFLTICIICFIVFIPLTIILSSLAIEINTVYKQLTQNNTQFSEIITNLFSHLPNWIINFLTDHNLNNTVQIKNKLSEFVLQGGKYLASSAFLIGKGTFSFIIKFGIMLYLLFFLLKDGSLLANQILRCLPLSNDMKHHLFSKFVAVARATVKSMIAIAVIQGTMSSIAFYIVGIDDSILLGAVITVFSLLPTVGPAIIWIPVAIYLFVIHQAFQGFFIICFFLLVVGLIDNFLRPLLVGKNTKIPDYLILIATLGSIEIYGIDGFISGPLIASLFISCWNLLPRYNQDNNLGTVDKKFID